jgi:hypothetical protein
VIAVPWFQLEHLPDVLIIAHEVGHHVFVDLGLDNDVVQTVREVKGEVRESWTEEMFCDVYGTLCAGSAFASSLGDFLRVAEVANDATDRYPPTTTRLALCLAVLELPEVGSEAASVTLRQRWSEEGLEITEEERQLGLAVATAIATTPYQVLGKRLVDLGAFTAAQELRKDQEKDELMAGREVSTRDPRVLFAAASSAFTHSPEGYRAMQIGASVLEAAKKIREPGVRWRVGHDAGAKHDEVQAGDAGGKTPAGERARAIYELLTQESTDT